MKKLIPLVLIATLGMTGVTMANTMPVSGGFNGGTTQAANGSGFVAGTANVISVEQAKQLQDDAWVTLRGHIIQQVGEKDYIFKDSSGNITVEIDHKRWRGVSVSPTDLVEITGEVDKDWSTVEIDVKQIQIVTVAK